MNISCIVIDDEDFAVEHLQKFIMKVPYLILRGSFTNPTEAIKYLKETPVDLVFIDIEMPNYEIDGIDFIKIMSGEHLKFIVTTAYAKYALNGYELNVADFLHKPFSFDRFLQGVQRVQHSLKNEGKGFDSDYIFIKADGKLQSLRYEDICYIQSERNNISIYTENDRINTILSISEVESKLPPDQFSRVHKQYVIALNKVHTIEKDLIIIRRQSNFASIPLGESYRKSFTDLIDQRILNSKK
ncbi:LytTR family DNA-binding domain-containing protein [Siphonobacter sp. SORGH_AS_1065]|uniref:LytR/AlgR family response regulator transcription factor n=1 Tax=Siphonobacter sp. SORGH_AS_1065 TaxID=3041795 RepID=UPI0027891E9A|nr:response regulator transcription factor [Siphonobacter sp. SORGH_AS_1065]MDQ1090442.1 two-component system LytT family response regulator [Siphonobacter sp. SORGH_AS_1065]